MDKTKMIVGVVAGIVVIGSGSFYGGMKYDQSKSVGGRNGAGAGRGQFTAGAGSAQRGARTNANGGFIAGEVLSKDDKSVTLKLTGPSGGSKIVFFSGSTQIMKSDQGAVSDLAVGQQVMAQGTPNSDGSINAQSIQIRPAGEPFVNRTASST